MKKLLFVFLFVPCISFGANKKKDEPQPVPQQAQPTELQQLYTLKGQLVTQLEIANQQLQEVNKRIAELLQKK